VRTWWSRVLVHLDFDHMNLPAGAGSPLDGAAPCRASKGRPVPRAGDAHARHRSTRVIIRSIEASALSVPLWRSRPRPPRTASPARHLRCRPGSLFLMEHDKFTSTSDAPCSTAANLMIRRQPRWERRADMAGVPETCSTWPARKARFSADPASLFRPFQNRLIEE